MANMSHGGKRPGAGRKKLKFKRKAYLISVKPGTMKAMRAQVKAQQYKSVGEMLERLWPG